MAKTIGGWYTHPEDELQDFAVEVSRIVKQKLDGTYINIEPEIVGGWHISASDQEIQKAEVIADAVVLKLKEGM